MSEKSFLMHVSSIIPIILVFSYETFFCFIPLFLQESEKFSRYWIMSDWAFILVEFAMLYNFRKSGYIIQNQPH